MYQQITIVGNLGRDPEMRYTADGTPVTNFSVAVSKKRKDGEDKVWWFKVSCWRRLAETTNQYLKKGSPVLIVGEVDASAWTDRDGNAQASLEVTAFTVKFLSGGDRSDDRGVDNPAHGSQGGDAELPF